MTDASKLDEPDKLSIMKVAETDNRWNEREFIIADSVDGYLGCHDITKETK